MSTSTNSKSLVQAVMEKLPHLESLPQRYKKQIIQEIAKQETLQSNQIKQTTQTALAVQLQQTKQMTELCNTLKSHPILAIRTPQHTSNSKEWLFQGGLIWNAERHNERPSSLDEVIKSCNWTQKQGNKPWRACTSNELIQFAAHTPNNPWRVGQNHRLFSIDYHIVQGGRIDLDGDSGSVSSGSYGYALLMVCDSFKDNLQEFIKYAIANQWIIYLPSNTTHKNSLLPTGLIQPYSLASPEVQQKNLIDAVVNKYKSVQEIFTPIDHQTAQLPPLELADFTDPNKGLWELWGLSAQALQAMQARARNPVDDVQQGAVAIDFGTSSTVVAFEHNGVGKLLRIGVTNFWEKEKPAHYENPTVLEFVDFPALLKPWQSEAYRPSVVWGDVRCSHEALNNLRSNQTDTKVVSSILTKIKQWALREGNNAQIRLTDQTNGCEHELAPLTLRNPVKGQALTVSQNDPFDPAELYAWFLGLTINWRRRGIFLRYYMTFPVDYPREVKDKILASFRRGLQRSLPQTLVNQPAFERFTVEERASEPAAYAAAAMPVLEIQPTTEGVAYAVFDFGGGTTDFDFGFYRLPTETEEDNGIEQVFEHFGSGGDKFLGGENLLEHLAYITFLENLEVCRKEKIAFTKPLDAEDFSGSEMFLERTQAATTNTLMLVSYLRDFWEKGEKPNDTTGTAKIALLPREGDKKDCVFKIPYDTLKVFLDRRIKEGVQNFFTLLKKAFSDKSPREIQILLAGNAARSSIVTTLFGLNESELDEERIFDKMVKEAYLGETPPDFVVHRPLVANEQDVNQPTGKTGVALGLLALCPGGWVKAVNHSIANSTGDAPFQHYVGRIRQRRFHPSLLQAAPYNEWTEIGPVGEDGIFKLFHTQAARALENTIPLGDPALLLQTLYLTGTATGQHLFARAIKPHIVEVCTAASLDAAKAGDVGNVSSLKLG